MMDFQDTQTRPKSQSRPSPNLIEYHTQQDAPNLMKLHKYGFFYGNSSRKFNISLTLPQSARHPSLKKTINCLVKSKRVFFIRDIELNGWTSNFPAYDEVKLGHLLRRTKKLKKFSIDKRWSEAIIPRFIKRMSKSFSKLYFFKHIKLNLLGSTDIKTEDIRRMGLSLSRSLRLQTAEIDLVGCNGIGIKGIQFLLYRFSKLQHLRNLYINLSNCFCLRNEAGYLDFSNTIGKLNKLQALNIALDSDILVADECLEDIAAGVAKLQGLKTFTLSLGDSQIGNAGLIKLGQALSVSKNLEEIVLEMWRCPKIEDSGVTSLLQGIQNLKTLKKLELNFSNCSLITDGGAYNVGEYLQGLENLESLKIRLFGCASMTEHGVSTLAQKVQGLPKVKNNLEISS